MVKKNNLENLHQMKEEVTRVATMLETLEENVRFIMDRRNSHYDIIKDMTDGIKSITFTKIVIIVFISIVQIMLIGRFFKNSKKIGLNPFYDSGL
jgi:hypothetical protein